MLPALATRILRTTDKRCLWKCAWNFGVKGIRSVELYKSRLKRGEHFPPFLFISVISSCNLRCQGLSLLCKRGEIGIGRVAKFFQGMQVRVEIRAAIA